MLDRHRLQSLMLWRFFDSEFWLLLYLDLLLAASIYKLFLGRGCGENMLALTDRELRTRHGLLSLRHYY